MTRRMKSISLLTTFAASLAMAVPAEAALIGSGACFSTQQGVHTRDHHQKRSCGWDCVMSLKVKNNSLKASVYDFHIRNHDLWEWDVFADRDWIERPLTLRAGVVSNDTRFVSPLPISSKPIGELKRKEDTVDKGYILLEGLQPNHYYTFIIYSPELEGVNSRGGHTAPFVRTCFRA